MRVLRGSIGITVVRGQADEGAAECVAFRLRHKKIGGADGLLLFMMGVPAARQLAAKIVDVCEGGPGTGLDGGGGEG